MQGDLRQKPGDFEIDLEECSPGTTAAAIPAGYAASSERKTQLIAAGKQSKWKAHAEIQIAGRLNYKNRAEPK